MVKFLSLAASLSVATLISGCVGLTPYKAGQNTVIATNQDTGLDKSGLANAKAAIAYDPDGCQGWIIDDGAEGYSGRRFDPASGLPVCNSLYPPGTVLGNYTFSGGEARSEWVPKR